MSDAQHLSAALGSYPHTVAIKSGALTSPEVTLDFTEVEPIHKAFAPMVRRQAYELSELAIVTAIQALAYKKPIVLLPAVVASRLQRGCIIALASKGEIDPRSLANKRIGVRAYTQTTGMWVRAALREDYGARRRGFPVGHARSLACRGIWRSRRRDPRRQRQEPS